MLRSRALVLPSFAEGLPVVIMESFALYRPAISTYVAGIPELIEDEVNGWLIPSGSVTALTDAMEKAISLPGEQLEAMGKSGAFRVAQDFNAQIEAQKLASLFRQHLTEPEPSEVPTQASSSLAGVR